MKVLIIGAGWYGCHLALQCLRAGHQVRIVDKANTFFAGSSSKNQNRLHLGYHYPRCANTIAECRRGFQQFLAAYGPICTSRIPNNLYLIADDPATKTTPSEFKARFPDAIPVAAASAAAASATAASAAAASATAASAAAAAAIPFSQLNGCREPWFRVEERHIDNVAAKFYFSTQLAPHFIELDDPNLFETLETLRTAMAVETDEVILNCTYNQLAPIDFQHYELYVSLLYRIPSAAPFAITIMDGPYFSLYPHTPEESIYTLTSVQHGVVWSGTDLVEAAKHPPTLETIAKLRNTIEAETTCKIPDFKEKATFVGHFTSWKTKYASETDDRSVRIRSIPERREIHIYGGKITGMFDAADTVLRIMRDWSSTRR